MGKIRVAIVGYGNVGRGAEKAINKNHDMELAGIFTRRTPNGDKQIAYDDIKKHKDKIDVMLLCGGSATDLAIQGPYVASMFNTVDTFDTHGKIPEYFAAMEKAAKPEGHYSLISIGWDPGLFSVQRLWGEAFLPNGTGETFWGRGVSQGHSDAIRHVDGVKHGVQYTVPIESAVEKARAGTTGTTGATGATGVTGTTGIARGGLTPKEKHKRICYVVSEQNADKTAITKAIVEMPFYFSDYNTEVNFIDEETFYKDHQSMPHGGFVINSGTTGSEHKQRMEFQLALDSNPEFTAGVLVTYARAAVKMNKAGFRGAGTIFDVPPAYLSAKPYSQLIKELL